MARKTRRAALVISADERRRLERLSAARTAPGREVERAAILSRYAAGIEAGLKDRCHRAKAPVITEEAKAWVMSIARTKPKDQGLAAELWSLSALARFTRERAAAQGHPSLERAGKATIWRILNAGSIKPHKVRYYMERRDARFEEKMREVLMVYQEVALQNASLGLGGMASVITVSLDEKPGVQAIGNTAPDLPPVPGQHRAWGRDHEYKRHGTLSILAAADLHNGHIFSQVHERHRSREHIQLLRELDEHYPEDCTIRVILDNHSSHISKETMACLGSRPNRYVYVHAPEHGSWLNLIETVFSRMARTFLRHIRVRSREELQQRILQGVREMNLAPIAARWKRFDLGIV